MLGDHGQLVTTTTAEEISDALNGHPISRTLPTRAGIIITADVALRDAMLTAALESSSSPDFRSRGALCRPTRGPRELPRAINQKFRWWGRGGHCRAA